MLKADLVGVGVIGTGRAGRVHAENFARHIPGARLVALCDTDENRAREVASLYGVQAYTAAEDFFKHPALDAVVVATPTFTHARLVKAAAAEKKAILCEKPLALTDEEAQEMEAAVQAHGVVFVMGFMRRFDRSFNRAREILQRGDIGEPLVVKSTGRGPGLPPRWAWDVAGSNGMLGEVNSHDFDCVRFLTGREFQWIFAAGRNNKCPDLAAEYPDFYDTAVVAFGMTGGVLGTVDGSCPADYGYDARVEIQGSDGVMFIGQIAQKGVVVGRKDLGVMESIVDSWRSLFREAYLAEERCLVEALVEGRRPPSTLEDGRKALQVVLAANRSIRTGTVERL